MANYEVTAPDGTKYQITAPDNATQDQVISYAQSQHQVPQEQPSLLSKAADIGNTVASNVMLPGASAMSTLAKNLPQSSNPAIAWLQNKIAQGPLSNIGEATNAVSSIPTQVLTNKVNDINRIQASPLFGKRPADYGAQSNAALQAGADIVGGLAPMLLTPEAEAPKTASLLAKETPFAQANRLGLVIRPSDAAAIGKGGRATIGPTLEGLAGDPQIAQNASVRNQPQVNRLLIQDIRNAAPGGNIDPNADLSPETFDAARAPNEATYQKVAGLGTINTDSTYAKTINGLKGTADKSFPKAQQQGINADIQELRDIYSEPQFDAGDALEHIKDLRANSRANYAAAQNPMQKNAASLIKLAQAQETTANALIDQIDRWAESRPEGFGQTGIGQEFKQARKNLAVINTIEDSVKPGTTDADASFFAKQLGKNKPLSGNAKEIGQVYNNFKDSMKYGPSVPNKSMFRRLDMMMGAGGAAMDALTGKPGIGAKMGGLILAAPGARSLLLSPSYQSAMLPKAVNPFLYGLQNPLLTGAITQGNQ